MLTGHTGPVHSVAFSSDGIHVISGCDNGTLQLWDVTSGMLLDTVIGNSPSAKSVASFLDSVPQSSRVTSFAACPGYIMEDEWILLLPQKRRLCWLPVSCRPNRIAWQGNHVALGTKDGRVVIFDFTGMDSYLDALRLM